MYTQVCTEFKYTGSSNNHEYVQQYNSVHCVHFTLYNNWPPGAQFSLIKPSQIGAGVAKRGEVKQVKILGRSLKDLLLFLCKCKSKYLVGL